MNINGKTITTVLLSAFFICACSEDTENNSFANQENKNANPSVIPYSTNLEIPKLDGGNGDFYIHETNYNGKNILNYCLEWHPKQKHSRWVAFTFTKTNSAKNWNRNNWKEGIYWDGQVWNYDPFQPDRKIPAGERSELSDFRGSGYDRGHLCASEDRVFSMDANGQTFYLSNMSPQIGTFNQDNWVDLENQVRTWGRNDSFRDTLYVVKGGTISDGQTKGKIGSGVVIPKYYFMALLCKKYTGGQNTYKAIGFWMEHKAYYPTPKLSSWTISIDEKKKKTGIDFFCNLPDRIENPIEKTFSLESWPGLK